VGSSHSAPSPNLVAQPALPHAHDKWTVLVHLDPTSTLDLDVRVTDRYGEVHEHVIHAAYLLPGTDVIAIGTYAFVEQTHPVAANQHVMISPRFTTSANAVSGEVARIHGLEWEIQGTPPSSFDYTTGPQKGCWPGVFNQGSCGNCYAWASMIVGSSRECKGKTSVRAMTCLQGQWLPKDWTVPKACEGGWNYQALNYQASKGMIADSSYPLPFFYFLNSNPGCSTGPPSNPSLIGFTKSTPMSKTWKSVEIGDKNPLTANQITIIQTMLMNYGPLGYNIKLPQSFQFQGSNMYGWFGTNGCKGDSKLSSFQNTKDGCCYRYKKRDCTLGYFFCKDNSAYCNVDLGGHGMQMYY
jgi:hypothetical protein